MIVFAVRNQDCLQEGMAIMSIHKTMNGANDKLQEYKLELDDSSNEWDIIEMELND